LDQWCQRIALNPIIIKGDLMPTIHDKPRVEVQTDLSSLSAALDAAIPPKIPEFNLLIATWNE